MKEFIAAGKDGFDCLVAKDADIKYLINEEGSVLLQTMILNFFERMRADHQIEPRREIGR